MAVQCGSTLSGSGGIKGHAFLASTERSANEMQAEELQRKRYYYLYAVTMWPIFKYARPGPQHFLAAASMQCIASVTIYRVVSTMKGGGGVLLLFVKFLQHF